MLFFMMCHSFSVGGRSGLKAGQLGFTCSVSMKLHCRQLLQNAIWQCSAEMRSLKKRGCLFGDVRMTLKNSSLHVFAVFFSFANMQVVHALDTINSYTFLQFLVFAPFINNSLDRLSHLYHVEPLVCFCQKQLKRGLFNTGLSDHLR